MPAPERGKDLGVAHTHAPGEAHASGARSPARADVRALRTAFAITVSVLLLEAVGGVLTGSVALLADAGHMLTDAGALALALGGAWLAQRPRTAHKSFGYGRVEILVALVNGLLLGGVSVAIIFESIGRLTEPRAVAAGPMIAIATVGLAANLLSAWLLHRYRSEKINVRAVFAHVVGDALGSVAAILAGIAILVWDMTAFDAIAGLGVAALLIIMAFRLTRESLDILLEGAPRDLDVEQIRRQVCEIPGVGSVHDLHVWTVSSGFLAMSAHVDVESGTDPARIRRAIHALLHQRYQIRHTTIQTEEPPELLEIQS